MHIRCRPMEVGDFGVVECVHWDSADQVRAFTDHQGIASMLAFDGTRCVGQLYLKEYDPAFQEPGGWTGERCWADFHIAEPLGLDGRFLTLGCYHVGRNPDGSHNPALYGQGIGTALLEAVVGWFRGQQTITGLLAWGLVNGSKPLQEWAGQMPHGLYERFGFQEIKRVRDQRLDHELADLDTTQAEEDPTILRAMVLRHAGDGSMRTAAVKNRSHLSSVRHRR
jgi:GNAT superfamily N-acetyltransferase